MMKVIIVRESGRYTESTCEGISHEALQYLMDCDHAKLYVGLVAGTPLIENRGGRIFARQDKYCYDKVSFKQHVLWQIKQYVSAGF